MALFDPIDLGGRTARNRLVFGPHVTNLGRDRTFSDRHVAYYLRRAKGGCGTIVLETASVHDSDWPYERAPLARDAPSGWKQIARALQAEGALAIAGLGHAGGQGSSAYHQRELWAPSRVPEVNSREVPKWMEPEDIAAVVAGFANAAQLAVEAGCDGVEINAGQHSLIRQFLSGLTNHRDDEWGTDRLRFARDVIRDVRAAVGTDAVVGLRLCCDELAPWAGITPDHAPQLAAALAHGLDYLVVVRGSIYSVDKTQPDFHEPTNFNVELTRAVRTDVPRTVAVVLQGSVVDPADADEALVAHVADLVEMTRALLADPDLPTKAAAGDRTNVRPCIRCNQVCQVRDPRNPIVSCVVEPSTGHELDDPDWYLPTPARRRVLVIGGGPAGLECARVAARRGHLVRLLERAPVLGGMARQHGPGAPLVAWLEGECRRAGVDIQLATNATAADLDHPEADIVVLATGSLPGRPTYEIGKAANVIDVASADPSSLPTRVAIWDPVGGPIGIALAEQLGDRAVLVTPDPIAGNELSRTGDLAPANVRLQQAGVRLERRTRVIAVRAGEVEVEHKFSGERSHLAVDALVDAGPRLPDDQFAEVSRPEHLRVGDCVAPRTLYEAVLEGRRAALAIDAGP